MSKDFIATIREGSPREQDWLAVFGSREIAIKSWIPQPAGDPGIDFGWFYELVVNKVKSEQVLR